MSYAARARCSWKYPCAAALDHSAESVRFSRAPINRVPKHPSISTTHSDLLLNYFEMGHAPAICRYGTTVISRPRTPELRHLSSPTTAHYQGARTTHSEGGKHLTQSRRARWHLLPRRRGPSKAGTCSSVAGFGITRRMLRALGAPHLPVIPVILKAMLIASFDWQVDEQLSRVSS